jgi:hypothetical protein
MVLKKFGWLALAGLTAGAAHADLTYTTTLSGANNTGQITSYMKGSRFRTEIAGRVTITDGTRTWLINPEKKTYSVVANQKLESSMNPMMEQFNQMIDMSLLASVKPGGKTRTILGKPAQNYVFSIDMKMKFKPGSGPKGATGEKPMTLPQMKTTGEIWATQVLPPPPRRSNMMNLANGFRMLGAAGQSAGAAFDKVKGFPLETNLKQVTTGSSIPGGGKGSNVSVKMTVTSLKADPLPDSLFVPPAGFKQVPYEAPSLPKMSGMGGGGGM